MTRKGTQILINEEVECVIKECDKELDIPVLWIPFRSCSAHVAETEHFFVLMSYNTIVACIDKHHKIGYDFLRKVYGYTSTSAQHISKFMHDYYVKRRLTWYSV